MINLKEKRLFKKIVYLIDYLVKKSKTQNYNNNTNKQNPKIINNPREQQMWKKQQSKNQKNGPKKIHSYKKAQNSARFFSSSKSLSSNENSSTQQKQQKFGQIQYNNNKNNNKKKNKHNNEICKYWMKGICKNSYNCDKKHYQTVEINNYKNLPLCNIQQINQQLSNPNLVQITISETYIATIEQLKQIIEQKFDGLMKQIRISYKNNKSLKKMNKEKINNQRNQNIDKEERKKRNQQIINKFIPLINKDTKEENAQKITLAKQKKLERKKTKKQLKQIQYEIVSEIDDDDIEIEENKQNTQQQDQLQQITSIQQQQYVYTITQQQYQQQQMTFNNKNKLMPDHQPTQHQFNQQQQTNQEPMGMSRYICQSTKAPDITQQQQLPIDLNLRQKLQQSLNQTRKSINKQYRDGQRNENISESSRDISIFNNSNDLETVIQTVSDQKKIYDLETIINTKSYRNNDLQHLISLNDIKLDTKYQDKFIRGCTFQTIISIKEQYQTQLKQLTNYVGIDKIPLTIIYDQDIWEQQIMKKYSTELRNHHIRILQDNDQDVQTEFKQFIILINRYIKRAINISIQTQQTNQAIEIKKINETPNQRLQNIGQVTQLTIELLRNNKEKKMDAITYQLDDKQYSVYFIDGNII